MRLYCILPFGNPTINFVIPLIKFHSFGRALNSIYFCYSNRWWKNVFVHFTTPRRLKTTAPACLPSPAPPAFNMVGVVAAASNTRMQSFYYQNGQLAHKILIKPKNGHVKYKVPGTSHKDQNWKYIKSGIVRASVNTSRVYRWSVKDFETRSVRDLKTLVYCISLNKDWHKEVI